MAFLSKQKFIFTAVVTKEKGDKYFVAECPQLGIASQGKTIKEARENLIEATELYLEEFPEKAEHAVQVESYTTTIEVLTNAAKAQTRTVS